MRSNGLGCCWSYKMMLLTNTLQLVLSPATATQPQADPCSLPPPLSSCTDHYHALPGLPQKKEATGECLLSADHLQNYIAQPTGGQIQSLGLLGCRLESFLHFWGLESLQVSLSLRPLEPQSSELWGNLIWAGTPSLLESFD